MHLEVVRLARGHPLELGWRETARGFESLCLRSCYRSSMSFTTPTLSVYRLTEDAILPRRAHPNDAGMDVSAIEDVILEPGARTLVGTGLAVAVPTGLAIFIHPRSGLAAKHGVSIVNAPGTVDSGYRGEVKVNLINLGQERVHIAKGDRIAQLIVQKVELCEVVEVESVDALGDSARGTRGHGSTGV